MELKSRKQELKEAEKLFQSLNPAVEQVQAKRAEAEAELKALTDERNQITLKMSQQRALFEAEKQILADTQVVVARERGIVEIARQEVAQAERAVALMTSEKQNIESELANIRQEEEECKRLLRDFSEKKSVLRTQLDQLRGDQSSSAKMLEVNQKLLASAQTEYQQIKMDVQGAESRLEYDKTRTQAISNQIAVQSAINDKERIKMKQLNESIASMATSRDALDANLRNLNAENASMISANNSARSSLAAIPQVGAQSLLLTQDNKNMSGSAFSSNANIAPSSSAANMPLNSSFAANGSVVTPVGGATVSVSPARSAKEEFDSLFDSNAPKSKQNLRRSSSSSFKPEFSGPDKNYPTSVKSLNVLEGSQQQKDRPLSVRSLNLQSSTASSNSPATNGNILDMLAFTTPVAAAGTSDSATSSQANLNNGGATSGSNQQPPPRPPSNAKPSVSGAGSSLSAPPFTRINATIPEANESTPPDQAMKVQATTTPLTASVSNMVLPASMANINIEEEMKRAFTGGGGTNITQTVRSVSPSKMDDAVFQNVSTDFGEDAFKFEASFDTSKSFASRSAATATTAANSTYDIFASAFGGKPAAISSNFASANTSFNNAATNVSFAMAPGSFSVQGVDPFETAFGPTSAKGTAGAAAASSKIDFDAVFGPATGFAPSQPATQQKPVASSSAAVFSFDDAFAASGFDGQQQQQQPRPVSPSKSLNGDLGAEVKQLLSMGFTKEQAVQALEK